MCIGSDHGVYRLLPSYALPCRIAGRPEREKEGGAVVGVSTLPHIATTEPIA